MVPQFLSLFFFLDCTGVVSSPTKKIFGILSNWLKVTEKSLRMIFLTASRIGPITDHVLPPSGNKHVYPHLEDNEGLIDYLSKHYIDIVVLRGHGASNDRCFLIDGLFSRRFLSNGRLIPYMTIPTETANDEKKSLSKCKEAGVEMLPFHHQSFKLGPLSPGAPNNEG